MERAAAIKKLRKLLGKDLAYRVDPKAPTADERAAAQTAMPALNKAKQDAERAMTDRRQALLAGDAEYQALVAAWKEARDRAAETFAITHRYRFTAGTASGMFFHVKAQGDSWREVIAILEKPKR